MVLFKIYDQAVAATIHLLDQLNVKFTNTAVNKTILSHPDYPSLLNISDSLAGWNIAIVAVKHRKFTLHQPYFSMVTNCLNYIQLVT